MHIKKLKIVAVFLVGVIMVFSLIATRNFFKTNAAHGDTVQNLAVFADQLSPQFTNWSWNSTVNLSNTSPVYSGTSSISFSPSAWGALYLHSNTTIDPSAYTSLQFAMQTSDQEKNFTVVFYDANNQQIKSLPLSQYPGVSQNGWMVYTIPLSLVSQPISGFSLQETSGSAGPVVSVDSIQFIANQPLPTTVSTNQTYPIYSDALSTGWINWSWSSSLNFSLTTPVYQGATAASFATTSGYGGFYLHTDQGIDTTPYQVLTFAAKAGGAGQTYSVTAYDTNNQQTHPLVALDNYGGQPGMDSWKTYNIPLQDLNANGKTMKGILIQDTSGKSQQTLYLDSIALGGAQTAQTNTVMTISTAIVTPTTAASTVVHTSGNPLAGHSFFNDPDANPARQQEQKWHASRPNDAAAMAKIADQPKAIWMGSWNSNIQSDVQTVVDKAASANTVPLFVAYNIPNRDCGSYSAGGSGSLQSYDAWISSFAQGIGNRHAAVVLEPDAVAQVTCLSANEQSQRFAALSYAVQTLKALANTTVYIDAGHSGWIAASDMANRMNQAGIAKADGFALNVSNFMSDSDSISYGTQLSSLMGGKHFILDTSRNGNGSTLDNQWCNPDGRALGNKPTTQTNNALVDASVWIKYPGESDGTCNGAPAAGVWDASYALGLAQRAHW